MVALIIDDPKYCGIAYTSTNIDNMFSVTKWSCATGYYSFGHELGHNMVSAYSCLFDTTWSFFSHSRPCLPFSNLRGVYTTRVSMEHALPPITTTATVIPVVTSVLFLPTTATIMDARVILSKVVPASRDSQISPQTTMARQLEPPK